MLVATYFSFLHLVVVVDDVARLRRRGVPQLLPLGHQLLLQLLLLGVQVVVHALELDDLGDVSVGLDARRAAAVGDAAAPRQLALGARVRQAHVVAGADDATMTRFRQRRRYVRDVTPLKKQTKAHHTGLKLQSHRHRFGGEVRVVSEEPLL